MLASEGAKDYVKDYVKENMSTQWKMARKMLEDKLPIEKIAEYSGLSPEDVHRLEEQ